jgi:hypothetical protein
VTVGLTRQACKTTVEVDVVVVEDVAFEEEPDFDESELEPEICSKPDVDQREAKHGIAASPAKRTGLIRTPTWHLGDAWVVRYKLEQPMPSGKLRPVEVVWEYQVVEAAGGATILAHQLTTTVFWDYRLFYASNGRFTRVEAGDHSSEDITLNPFFEVMDDWNAEALPKAWPAFPCGPANASDSPVVSCKKSSTIRKACASPCACAARMEI